MDNMYGYIFSGEQTELLTPEELEEIKGYPLPRLIEVYCQRTMRNSLEVQKQLTGDYDFRNAQIRYFKSFFPTSQARRSWLYLQSLLDASFGNSYYTVRDGLVSWLLLETTGGEGWLKYEGKTYRLGPGDVFLIDCQRLHDYRTADTSWSYRLAHFCGNSMEDYYAPILASGNAVFHFDEGSQFGALFSRLYEVNRADAPESELLTNCILTQLLTEILKTLPQFDRTRYPQRIRDVCAYLTEHCCEPLTVDEIADHFAISKYYLCREFKKHTDKTIFAFIEEARLSTAKQLLRYTDLPVAAVADCAGFQNLSNFGRVFKKAEGTSPSAYRKEWNGI